jgi:hypothetical protein
MNMIEKDKSRMILLQTVHFEFVSSDLMKRFFENIHNDEIDFELFESLKKRLFADYSDEEKLSKRWKTMPKYLNEIETNRLFNAFESYFGENKNPIKQIQILVEESQKFKIDNKRLQTMILQLEKENCTLKGKTIGYQNNYKGILQDLRNSEPNSISISCSSVNHNHQAENILIRDNSS